MKKICKSYQIPTAKFKICKNKSQVNDFLKKSNLPLVVKADGLAAGELDEEGLVKLNMLYAKDYRVANDINIVFKGFRELGR